MAFENTNQETGSSSAIVYAKLMRRMRTGSKANARSPSNCISMIGTKNTVESRMAK